MDVKAIAQDLVAMWRRGEFAAAGEKYWAQDVVSVEAGGPGGMDPVSRGIDAARGKSAWWASAHEVHAVKVSEPFVNGEQFIVGFEMEVTARQSGQRFTMVEQALYTLRDGRIAEERFFSAG